MLLSRLHKRGDLIRYTDPGSGAWYDARLRNRERRDGQDGWAVVVTNNGTFGAEILGETRHLSEQQMTPISGRARGSQQTVYLALCLLIAVALVAVGCWSFLHHDTQAGALGLAAAVVVVVVTGVVARRWGRRLS